MSVFELAACGDDLVSVTVDDPRTAQRIAAHLRDSGDFREAVAGIGSVVVQFDAARVDPAGARTLIERLLREDFGHDRAATALIEVPVIYGGDGGPDLGALCAQLGLTRETFIELHTRGEYRVDMLGFTPGFAYIGGLDERLDVARLAEPRVRVAAGSVGIAGGRTGLYALPGPGGWPLIGRTPLALFDPESERPFLLEPGMRVRFRAVEGP